MPKEDKGKLVNLLVGKLSRGKFIIATDYRGLSVAELAELRHQLRQQNIEYRVVKNTLTALAAERAGRSELCTLLRGPTALAIGYGDEAPAAKVVVDYQRGSKTPLSIKGGLLNDRILSPAEVSALASLPSREVLIAKLMGTLYSPVYHLLYVLTAELRGLLSVLQSRITQLEGE